MNEDAEVGKEMDVNKLKLALKKSMAKNKKIQEEFKKLTDNQTVLQNAVNERQQLIQNLASTKTELEKKNNDLIIKLNKCADEFQVAKRIMSEKEENLKQVEKANSDLISSFNNERKSSQIQINAAKKQIQALKDKLNQVSPGSAEKIPDY